MRAKWTAGLAAVLFVLAVLALTPVGNAARSLIALNGVEVDAIHASPQAMAGGVKGQPLANQRAPKVKRRPKPL